MKDEILAEIADLEARYGSEDLRVGEARIRLGFWIAENRLYSQGEPHFAAGLTILETHLGADRKVAETLDRWADLATKKRDVHVSEPYRLMSLAVKETVFGPKSPEVAAALERLSRDYCDQLRIAKAVPIAERELDVAESLHGRDSVEVAAKLSSLAGLLTIRERYSEAEPLHLRAVSIREAAGPADEKDLMEALGSLAWTRLASGRFDEAREPLLRSLAIRKVLFADEPARWVQPLEFLLDFYRGANRLVEGVNAILEGMDFACSSRPEVAVMLLNLAELLAAAGHAVEAVRLGRMSMEVTGRILFAGDADALRKLPEERRRLGFMERLRRMVDPGHLHTHVRWAPEDPVTQSFWNKEAHRRDAGDDD